jgi:hypothetical protein
VSCASAAQHERANSVFSLDDAKFHLVGCGGIIHARLARFLPNSGNNIDHTTALQGTELYSAEQEENY